jgi:hypothetical protein
MLSDVPADVKQPSIFKARVRGADTGQLYELLGG